MDLKDATSGRDLTGRILGPAEEIILIPCKKYFLINVRVPQNHRIVKKCLEFRLPEVPITLCSVKFRAGSIFEV